MPRLSVVAGPSLDALVPITVNSGIPHNIVSDAFEGQILAYIKGFTDDDGNVSQGENEYFQREDRKGITWSIQTQGRFLRPISADDVLFGNTFDRPLKLPWGSGAALKFMHFVDPTLDHDLTSSTKPWALSPLISTMPHLAHRRVPLAVSSPLASRSPSRSPSPAIPIPQPGAPHDLQSSKRAIVRNPKTWPPFPPPQSLTDDTAQLHLTLRSPQSSHPHSLSPSPSPSRHLSRQPSSSGRATPDSSDSSALPTLAIESADPGNPSLVPPSSTDSPSPTEKTRSKKNNRVSAASLSSLLSANHEDKRERRDRKRTEKLAKHEQALLELRTADRRRAYFRDASHRQELTFGPEDIFTTDFCYGFLQFTPTLSLNLPGGISFDLMHYWDGQPVRFVCCERKRQADGDGLGEGDAESDVPWGRVLWCVAIQLIPDEPQSQPHAHDAQRGSRIANGETNGAESHYQSGNGDSPSDGVD